MSNAKKSKPHIIFKDGQYWVFSSKRASLDCMPWYKSNNLNFSIELIRSKSWAKSSSSCKKKMVAVI